MAILRQCTFLIPASLCATAIVPGPATAQHMNTENVCAQAGSTVETVNCFESALKAADEELNDIYKATMAVLSEDGRIHLRASQRSWITVRDETCQAEGSPYRGYSGYGPAHSACLFAITRDRASFLKRGFDWKIEKEAESRAYRNGQQ